MKSQTERILKQLELGNVIGPIWGICAEPPILALRNRISELRREGLKIVSIKRSNKDGSLSPVCDYILKKFFDKNIHKEFFGE